MKQVLLIFIAFLQGSLLSGQSKLVCKFDTLSMSFKGSKTAQAKYLLRPVKKQGRLGNELRNLPLFLDEILNSKKTVIKPEVLKQYLQKNNIEFNKIGGDIDSLLSKTDNGITANYIVIHDASNLVKGPPGGSFPDDVNTPEWSINQLERYREFKNAHLFINRPGQSITCHDLNQKIQATKFESKKKNAVLDGKCAGNFIHIELIQPRMAESGKENDAIAIEPGFTTEQYKKLALIYLCASTRKGDWLIPVYHAVLDEGFTDAHDDPQHFELEKFVGELESLYEKILNL